MSKDLRTAWLFLFILPNYQPKMILYYQCLFGSMEMNYKKAGVEFRLFLEYSNNKITKT